MRVSLNGVDFDNVGATVVFEYTRQIKVHALEPRSGPTSPGTRVRMHGENLSKKNVASCRFGDKSKPLGIFFAESHLQAHCTAPAQLQPGPKELHLIFADNTSVPTGLRFYFHDPIVLESVFPSVISNISDHSAVTVTMHENLHSTSLAAAGSILCRFGGSETMSRAIYLSESKILCPVTDSARRVLLNPGDIALALSVNGGSDFSNVIKLTVSAPIVVHSIEPRMGPLTGGTHVSIRGVGFGALNVTHWLCQFGTLSTDALVKSSSEIICATPPSWARQCLVKVTWFIYSDDESTGIHGETNYLEYQYYPKWHDVTAVPMAGPASGGTLVSIVGIADLLRDMDAGNGHVQMQSRFGNSSIVPCTIDDNNASVLICQAPPSANLGLVPLMLSLNGVDFEELGVPFRYYEDVLVSSVDPTIVWTNRSTNLISSVSVFGGGFFKSPDLLCHFAADHYYEATFVSPSHILCPVPKAHSSLRGPVSLSVSANRLDWSESRVMVEFVDNLLTVTSIFPKYLSSQHETRFTLTGTNLINSTKLRVVLVGESIVEMVAVHFTNESSMEFTAPRVAGRDHCQ